MRRILTFFANRGRDRAASACAASASAVSGWPAAPPAAAILLIGAILPYAVVSPAFSGEPESGETKNAVAVPAPVVNCTCRYRGTDYHLGEAVCLNGPSGPRMATCDMVLNNTSWRVSETPCPSASLSPPPGSASRIGLNG